MKQTEAFTPIASTYEKFRPGYPKELVQRLALYLDAGQNERWPARTIGIDVGCGTGIFTRLLAETLPNASVIGLEPGEGMRATALSSTPAKLGIEYLTGAAEALPFPAGHVVLISAAQAIQWFDRPRFYAEAARVLLPGGVLAIVQNNRDWQGVRWLDAYERFLEENSPGYSRAYRDFDLEGELTTAAGFRDFQRHEARWTRQMSVDEFVGLSLSSTKVQAIVQRLGSESVQTQVRALIREFMPNSETVSVEYVCELYLARRE